MMEPSDTVSREPIPTARPIGADIPCAHPVTPSLTCGVPTLADELMLPTITRGAALLDIATLALLLISFTVSVETVVGLSIGISLEPEAGELPDSEVIQALLVPMLAVRAVGAIVVIALLLRHRHLSIRSVGLGRRGLPLNVLIGVGATIVAYGFIAVTMSLLFLGWPQLEEQMAENVDVITELIPKLHPLGFAGLAAMIGVYEELVFRGFVMTRLRRATGSWLVAVLVSSVIFVVPHALDQMTVVLVPVTILSVVFSVVTIWRRSIMPAIVAHTLFNLSQFLYLYFEVGDSWV